IKKAEAELERTKADFMAMLVHDLRSPLIGIKSVVELVLDAPPGAPLNEDHVGLLHSAQGSAKKLLELISDYLDVSKYEAGNITIEKSNVPVSRIVDPVVIQMGLQFKQKNITVTTHYAPNLPDVNADPGKTEQVVMNFLSNALKFTKTGGTIAIKAERDPENKDGKFVRVSITDDGVGIMPDEIPTLFSRYKQASSAKTIKQKGTGLGLVICKLIVETQGGKVGVTSNPGKETTFSFTLPVAE
ncbi:MAG: HAMP domain-containing histidine kinase, partial [Ignavibacteriales bacterium]|nr:HAMP domain-containing histidine kinase [Ignavibacteriales bacterium]